MLLFTGCKDSSSVTDVTTAAPEQTESTETTAETTVSSSSETTKTTASSGSTQESSGTQTEASSGSSSGQSSGGTVTTAPQGSQQQSGTTVTTASVSPKKQLRTTLSALSAKGEVYSVIDAGNGRVVVGCNSSGNVSTAYLIDAAADKLLGSVKLKDSYDMLVGVTPSDELISVYCHSDTETEVYTDLIYYSFADGSKRSVTCDMDVFADFQYDRASDTIYGVADKRLFTVEPDGSLRDIRKGGQNIRYISSFLPVGGITFEAEAARNDSTGMELAAYDTKSGARLYGFPDHYTSVYPLGSSVICTEGTYDEAKKKTVANAYVRDARTGAEQRRFKIYEGQHELFTSPYTGYALMMQWNEKNWHPASIIPIDPASGKRAGTGISLKSTTTAANVCYLKDLGLWAAAVTEGSYSKAVTRLSLIDPAQSDYGKSFGSAYAYGIAAGKKLGTKFEQLRTITDRIERETGVRVRIGNEVLEADQPSGYRLVSMEDDSYTEISEYREILLSLEQKLKLYPAGFFDKLRQPTADGNPRVGLRILVVDSLVTTTPGSTFTAGGVAYEGQAWYNIAIADYMLYESDQSIHHELWHIVEDLLNNSNNPLNMDAWNACNPKNFSYTNDFNAYYGHPEYEAYTFTSNCWDKNPATQSIYFSRDYSTVNGQEDRATLIERVFEDPGFYDGIIGQCRDGLEMVEMYPHLKAKLSVLAEAVKKCFGYVYWEEIAKAARAAA